MNYFTLYTYIWIGSDVRPTNAPVENEQKNQLFIYCIKKELQKYVEDKIEKDKFLPYSSLFSVLT